MLSGVGQLRFVLLVLAVGGLTGCSSFGGEEEFAVGAVETPASKDIRIASAHFGDGSYGNAQKHFRLAAEKEPNNPDAWLGLAASYDRLRRFDLADRAYKSVRKITGDTPEVLNNIGYSYLLRGDLSRARKFLGSAYRGNSTDPRILSNIETLNEMLSKRGQTPLPV